MGVLETLTAAEKAGTTSAKPCIPRLVRTRDRHSLQRWRAEKALTFLLGVDGKNLANSWLWLMPVIPSRRIEEVNSCGVNCLRGSGANFPPKLE